MGYIPEIYQFKTNVPIHKIFTPVDLITFTHEGSTYYAEIIDRFCIAPNETEIKAKKLTREEFMQKWEAAIVYTI
jgi:hypothetical protein